MEVGELQIDQMMKHFEDVESKKAAGSDDI